MLAVDRFEKKKNPFILRTMKCSLTAIDLLKVYFHKNPLHRVNVSGSANTKAERGIAATEWHGSTKPNFCSGSHVSQVGCSLL